MANIDDRPKMKDLSKQQFLDLTALPQYHTKEALMELVRAVHQSGGSYSINQNYDEELTVDLHFGRGAARSILQNLTMTDLQMITTDNTNSPQPGWVPQVFPNTQPIMPQLHPAFDPAQATWADPNRMPDGLLEELKAMRQDGEDVESVVRRLMRFAEEMVDLLDQARTRGMNV